MRRPAHISRTWAALAACGALVATGLAATVSAQAAPTTQVQVQLSRYGGDALAAINVVVLRQSASHWQVVASGTTDAAGTRTLTVPVGSYRVCAVEAGDRMCGPDGTSPGRAPVVVADGPVAAEVGLPAHSVVKGVVRHDGALLAGAQVVVLGPRFPLQDQYLSGVTDERGRYRLEGHVPGPFRVCAVTPGTATPQQPGAHACSTGSTVQTGTPLAVLPGQALVEDLDLAATPVLSGRVTLPDGSPAPGALQSYVRFGGSLLPMGSTPLDGNGDFALVTPFEEVQLCWGNPGVPLPAPMLACYGGPSTGVPVQAGTPLNFRIPEAGRVTGRVVDEDGDPVAAADVWLGQFWGAAQHYAPETVSAPSGEFELGGLAGGDHFLCASATGPVADAACRGLGHEERITVTPGQVTETGDVELTPTSPLTLQVQTDLGDLVPATLGIFVEAGPGRWQLVTADDLEEQGGTLRLPRGKFRFCTLDVDMWSLPWDLQPRTDWCHGASPDVADAADVVLDGTARSLTLVVPSGFGDYRALTAPEVSGTAKLGSTLSATPGTWSPSGASFSYQWRANGSPIPGVTGTNLTLTSALVGQRISVVVTASGDRAEDGSAASEATAPVESGTPQAPGTLRVAAKPKVSGKLKVGKQVKVSAGRYSPAKVTVRYQWFAGKKAVAKATKAKLKLTRKLKGKKLSVRVTVTAPGYRPLVLKVAAGKVR